MLESKTPKPLKTSKDTGGRTKTQVDSEATPRARRSTKVVRKAILRAARELFVQNGYAKTSTRAIATRARVFEPLLFRNFGRKEELFQEAVLESFNAFVQDHWERFFNNELPKTLAERTGPYVEGLYSLLLENRELIFTMFAAGHDARRESRAGGNLPLPLEKLFHMLEEEARNSQGVTGIEGRYAVRFTFALLVSVVVLDDWIMPPGRDRPDRNELVGALTNYVSNGVLHRGRKTEEKRQLSVVMSSAAPESKIAVAKRRKRVQAA